MKKKADKLHQPPTPSFVATFELEVNAVGFGQLEKMLNPYRQVYNATLSELVRRLKRARKSPEGEAARNLPKGSPERKAAFTEVRKKFCLSFIPYPSALIPCFRSTHRQSVSRDTWKRQLRAVCSEQGRKRLSGTGRIPLPQPRSGREGMFKKWVQSCSI